MAENDIFRKQALDTVSNPEQLDQHVRITKPSVWIIVIGILAIIIGFGIWAITGTITNSVPIRGVLFPADSVKMGVTLSGGTVTDVLVSESSEVEKGDILAVVPDETILEQIATIKSKYANATGSQKEEGKLILESLKNKYVSNSFITASKGGIINKIASLGSKLEPGSEVAINVANNDTSSSKEILAYVPYSEAINFKIGMEAQVTPSNLKREEYGYMVGTITKIGTSTITTQNILDSMGTTKYVSALGLTGTEVEVRIRINADSSSKNGFEWSNAKGANAEVNTGTICNIQIVTSSKKPIQMFID